MANEVIIVTINTKDASRSLSYILVKSITGISRFICSFVIFFTSRFALLLKTAPARITRNIGNIMLVKMYMK